MKKRRRHQQQAKYRHTLNLSFSLKVNNNLKEKESLVCVAYISEEPDGCCASSGILEEQLPPGDSPSVSHTILVGQKMVLDKCCNGIQLRDSLLDAFPSDDADAILARMRNHTEQTVRGKIFVVFIAMILLSQLRLTVRNIPPKQRRYWTEHEFLDKVASYTKVHFEGKYKDVYTVPTANQRHVFDMLELPYRYKGVAYNMHLDVGQLV